MDQVRARKTVPMTAEAFFAYDDTRLYWLGGAGFMLNVRGVILLIDPVLTMREDGCSENGLKMFDAYPLDAHDVPQADIVLYTHRDDDHLGPVTAGILAPKTSLFVCTRNASERLNELTGIRGCFTGRTGDRMCIKGIGIEFTPADHPWQLIDPDRFGAPFGPDDCCGFIIDTPDERFRFPGDTRLMPEHLSYEGIDVLALDVSRCIYHLGTAGAAAMANRHKDALLVPYHYGTYACPEEPAHNGDPDEVFQKVNGASERKRMLAPGEMMIIGGQYGS